jgi:hypothetical protein
MTALGGPTDTGFPAPADPSVTPLEPALTVSGRAEPQHVCGCTRSAHG